MQSVCSEAKRLCIVLMILGVTSAAMAQDVATLKKQAASGDAKAQFDLGSLYYSGHRVPQDYAQAAVWFRKAAEQGNAESQTDLGLRYIVGQGVVVDYAQAAIWFRKAANQGTVSAQFNLGESTRKDWV